MPWLSMPTRVGFSAILVLFSFPASAFDFDGAWATDASKCSKVFVKKKNGISLSRKSDFFGGGFMVGGDKISGALLSCKITSRKEESDRLHLITSCSTIITPFSPIEFNVRVVDENNIIRVYPDFPEMNVSYARCKL
jgi:hypothetical protein